MQKHKSEVQSNKVQDKKRDYLIKTLSRTKRKDYENYIVNDIYHKLNRTDVKPVTQQYIRRSDGKYALVDLYFPQINLGIECDEAYHINNNENDLERELTMEEMLDSVEETQGFRLRRVKAYETIDSINRQIDAIVSEINEMLKKNEIEPWNIDADPAEYAIHNRMLRVEDRLQFDRIIDLCKCFGKNYKGMQKSYFSVGHGYYIWCPKLAVMVDGKKKAVANGWLNTLASNWETIIEENDTLESIEYAAGNPGTLRATFTKSKDILGRDKYRFIGVYEFVKQQSATNKNVYRRVDTRIDLSKWL